LTGFGATYRKAALFPLGRSGIIKIIVADRRKDTTEQMQVVSGAAGREKVHFQAPDADLIEMEMKRFIHWFNEENKIDLVVKAAIAHLWFVTIHPFQDGNGRITRALTDTRIFKSGFLEQTFENNYKRETEKGIKQIIGWI
jgi:Fic family protein